MPADLNSLFNRAQKGDQAALSRLISSIENRATGVQEVIARVYSKIGRAHVIGITGPPGAGKSTLTDQLVGFFRAQKKRVAVLAVDPSSPFSGGAVLGDRVRMGRHAGDENVFIRSVGTRGRPGGLSHSTQETVFLLDALKYDTILIETAGVGQTELEIFNIAQTVVVVLVPESGDEIQVLKAGILEIADLFCVNKADRPEADKLLRELEQSFLGKIPVLATQAHRGVGVAELGQKLDEHKTTLALDKWRKTVLLNEVKHVLIESVLKRVDSEFQSKKGQALARSMVEGKLDPYAAAKKLLKGRLP